MTVNKSFCTTHRRCRDNATFITTHTMYSTDLSRIERNRVGMNDRERPTRCTGFGYTGEVFQ